MVLFHLAIPIPAGIYLFKLKSRKTRKICGICSRLTINTTEQIINAFLVSLLLTFNRFHILFPLDKCLLHWLHHLLGWCFTFSFFFLFFFFTSDIISSIPNAKISFDRTLEKDLLSIWNRKVNHTAIQKVRHSGSVRWVFKWNSCDMR